MAQLVPDEKAPGPQLQGIAGGGFRIDGTIHRAVLLTVEQAVDWPDPAATAAALAPLVATRPELILLGTGRVARHPGPDLVRAIEAEGIGLEIMDSRAAARAWVILRGEGRHIAAALMPLD